MPRPKRSRVASRPAPQSSTTPPPASKPVKPARQISRAASSDIYDVSDREKERTKKRVEVNLSVLDEQDGRSQLQPADSELARILEAARSRENDYLGKLDNLTSTSVANENEPSPHIEYSRRESASMAVGSRPPRLTDASGLDLDDDVFGNLDDSLDDSRDDTQMAHTSRATDTSSFNIAMFRRRPRQSSIVGKDDAPIRPSSRGGNTPSATSHLNLGRFKRRQREPSILGTAQKERTQRPPSRASDYGSMMGDDSGPEGESTPLDKKRQSRGQDEIEVERSPSLPSRKRKSLEDQGGREKRIALAVDGGNEEVIQQSIEVQSTPPGSPSLLRNAQNLLSTPDRDDPFNAPPASSSSAGSSPIALPSWELLTHRNYHTKKHVARAPAKTPELEADNDSDLSSPPSLTHSPNFGPTRASTRTKAKRKPAAAAPPKPVKLTTADLTALLPRRRQKNKKATRPSNDPFDVDSAEDDDEVNAEDDELSYVATTKRRRRGAATLAQTAATNRGAKAKKAAAAAVVAAAAAAEKKKKQVRKYGLSSDKENAEGEEEEEGEGVTLGSVLGEEEEEDPETSQLMVERMGEELKRAARKFQEVDRWELSFEEVAPSSDGVMPPEGEGEGASQAEVASQVEVAV